MTQKEILKELETCYLQAELSSSRSEAIHWIHYATQLLQQLSIHKNHDQPI